MATKKYRQGIREFTGFLFKIKPDEYADKILQIKSQ